MRKALRRFLSSALLAVLIIAATSPLWLRGIGRYLVAGEEPFTADAIENSAVTELNGELQISTTRDYMLSLREEDVQKAIQSSLDASKAIESTMRGVMFFLKERVTEEHAFDGK